MRIGRRAMPRTPRATKRAAAITRDAPPFPAFHVLPWRLDLAAGAISNQAYFMTIDNPQNKAFVVNFSKKFGADKPINAIGEDDAVNSTHWRWRRPGPRRTTR
jgi:hypothetical protein